MLGDSYEVIEIPKCMVEDARLRASSKLFYGILYYNHGRQLITANARTLADEMGCSPSSVYEYVDELKRCGYIDAENKHPNKWANGWEIYLKI
jgi:DNA-binding MarR family transcriptional regulator